MKAQSYYFQEPRRSDLKDPVSIAALRTTDRLSLEQMATLARNGVADLQRRNAARVVEVCAGDFA